MIQSRKIAGNLRALGSLSRGIAATKEPASSGPPSPPDPFFADVISLIHGDGPNGSTSFPDEKGLTWTSSLGAVVQDNEIRFNGTTSGLVGSGQLPSYWTFSGDFTIEAYLTLLAYSPTNSACVYGNINGFGNTNVGIFVFNNKLLLLASYNGTGFDISISDSSDFPLNSKQHIAVCRSGAVVRMFVNGVLVASTAMTQPLFNNGTNPTLGRWQFSGSPIHWLNGLMEEFRVTLAARYTANFTPPTIPFPNF